jgi:ketosteroid isomerase-like protein
MRTRLVGFIVIIAGVGAFTVFVGAQSRSVADRRAELMAVDAGFAAATAARGLEGWLAYAAPDAIFMPDGVDPVRGAEALRAFYTPFFARPGMSLIWHPVSADVSAADDLGYTTGLWQFRSLVDGKTVTRRGKYVTIWKRQSDGGWKAVVDIDNSGPPVAP